MSPRTPLAPSFNEGMEAVSKPIYDSLPWAGLAKLLKKVSQGSEAMSANLYSFWLLSDSSKRQTFLINIQPESYFS